MLRSVLFHLARQAGSLSSKVGTCALFATLFGAVDPLAARAEQPDVAQVGVGYTSVFAVTGAPRAASSYTVSGLPPGLVVDGVTVSAGTNVYSFNAPFGTITGTPAVSGNYSLTVTAWELPNSGGASRTYSFSIAVSPAANTPPVITIQPTGRTVSSGSSTTFSAAASGAAPLTYQWQKSGIDIAGATGATFSITSVTTADAGNYTLVATNPLGSATSNTATLIVAITAANSVASAIVTSGHDAMFSAGNAGGSIQWQISVDGISWSNLTNNSTYSGTTSSTLTVTNATSSLNNARYRFQATNGSVVATSNAARLTVAQAFFPFPTAVAADGSGNIFVCDSNTNTVQRISASGQVSLVAGSSGTAGSTDGTGSAARFNQPAGLVVTGQGVLFVADTANATVRRIATDGAVTTLAGSTSTRGSADGTGGAALFAQPIGLAMDAGGSLYVADAMNATIRKVTANGLVSTIAGTAGITGSADGTGTTARFNLPTGVAVDASGNIFVADTVNNTIRRISPSGAVVTVAGLAGVSGFADGTGPNALFSHPGGLAVDNSGTIYVADTNNSTIRKITSAGVVTTLAGLPGIAGLQDGSGSDALFNQPQSLTLDSAANISVIDTGNAALRRVTLNGVVTTMALVAPPAPTPDPTPTPTPTPTPAPAPQGGGGGGAIDPGLLAGIAVLFALRRCRLHSHPNAKFLAGR